jgi:hypothetical protein
MSISLDSITFPSISGSSISGSNIDNNSGPPVTANSMGANSMGSNHMGTNHMGANSMGSNSMDYNSMSGVIPLALVVIVIILIAYYILFASLGSDSYSNTDNSNKTIELLLWGLFILLILFNGMSYIFGLDVIASIKNIFSPVTTIDIKVKDRFPSASSTSGSGSGLERKKEVFHVSDNKYNYEDAKAVCSAYDGRLATYNEINEAYNQGADWCGFGWSDNQMALYPTQEEKWKKLQTIDGHHHDCGRPGINGGFIDNPNVKFGINCYGFKPDITSEEAQQMNNQQLYPKTKREIMFDKKVDYWRTKLSDIMVSPFNSDSWSII